MVSRGAEIHIQLEGVLFACSPLLFLPGVGELDTAHHALLREQRLLQAEIFDQLDLNALTHLAEQRTGELLTVEKYSEREFLADVFHSLIAQ